MTMYSATDILGFIAALGVLITALGAVIVNIVVALRQGKTLAAVKTETEGLVTQVKEVHSLTNSTNSRLQAALELKTQELASVRELMAQMERTAKEIAVTRTVTDLQVAAALQVPSPSQASAAAPPSPAAEQSLQAIDTSTKAIDANTRQPAALQP